MPRISNMPINKEALAAKPLENQTKVGEIINF